MLLMDESALRKRCSDARADILRRAKPVKWKSGPRQGKIKRAGITDLPFSSRNLWEQALSQVGEGVKLCPYCVEIGRPANLITLANYQWDHKVPAARGGTHTLDNLFAVCEDCNRCKGNLSYEFFIALMAAVDKWPDRGDRSSFHACLRTHGISQRLRGFHGKSTERPKPPNLPTTGKLALQEDF